MTDDDLLAMLERAFLAGYHFRDGITFPIEDDDVERWLEQAKRLAKSAPPAAEGE